MAKTNRKLTEVHIVCGLPASGKTSFLESIKTNAYGVSMFSENELQLERAWLPGNELQRTKPMHEDTLIMKILDYMPSYGKYLIDGLFLTTELIDNILEAITDYVAVDKIILHYWPEDKAECKRNDYLRRRIGSSLSIDLLSMRIDLDALKAKYPNLKVQQHQVYHVPDYVLFFREHNGGAIEDERYLKSATWSLGGIQYHYDGGSSPIDASEAPSQFEELNKLLLEVAPSLTMKDMMDINEECVTVEQKEDSDYYARATLAYYQCDMEHLYEILLDRGYIGKNLASTVNIQRERWVIVRGGTEIMTGLARNYKFEPIDDVGKAAIKTYLSEKKAISAYESSWGRKWDPATLQAVKVIESIIG